MASCCKLLTAGIFCSCHCPHRSGNIDAINLQQDEYYSLFCSILMNKCYTIKGQRLENWLVGPQQVSGARCVGGGKGQGANSGRSGLIRSLTLRDHCPCLSLGFLPRKGVSKKRMRYCMWKCFRKSEAQARCSYWKNSSTCSPNPPCQFCPRVVIVWANRTLGPPLENNPEIPPSSREKGRGWDVGCHCKAYSSSRCMANAHYPVWCWWCLFFFKRLMPPRTCGLVPAQQPALSSSGTTVKQRFRSTRLSTAPWRASSTMSYWSPKPSDQPAEPHSPVSKPWLLGARQFLSSSQPSSQRCMPTSNRCQIPLI